MQGAALHQVVNRAAVDRGQGRPYAGQVVAIQVVRLIVQVREGAAVAQDFAGVTRTTSRHGHVAMRLCGLARDRVAAVVVLGWGNQAPISLGRRLDAVGRGRLDAVALAGSGVADMGGGDAKW